MNSISQALKNIRLRISKSITQNKRQANSVLLLAVSKTQPASAVIEAAEAGQVHFGENYVQDALDKIMELKAYDYPIQWHYIGPIQSNKTKTIAENFQWVHSVDRLKIAQRLSDQRPTDLEPLNICIQVNISAEAQKSGISPEEVNLLAEQISLLPGLTLRGLMAIPAADVSEQQLHADFAAVKSLFNKLPQSPYLDTLSIGMSNDMEAAIAEGSTMVRIGTAVFGPRKVK